MQTEVQKCRGACGQYLEIVANFHRDNRAKNGRQSVCKACRKAEKYAKKPKGSP